MTTAERGEREVSGRAADVQQLYYTSCRRGLTGHAGFQTRAASPGLRPDERREIEANALYRPPRDAPRDPDAAQLATFPVAFRTVELSSGRTAVLRAVYNGTDYSGRPGNYFVHALILDGGTVFDGGTGRSWPIDLYAWAGWVDGLAPGDDDREPAALPAVSRGALSEVAPAPDFSFSGIREFLARGKDRQEMLARMLRAVFQRAHDSRNVVVRERSAADAVYWLASVQKAFPPAYRRDVACSTFQFDPRTVLPVNATVGKTDFLFNATERDYRFYVFDFVAGAHSDVPEDASRPFAGEYAGCVAEWMASNPDRLENFHAFAAQFDHTGLGPGLLHMLRLYRLQTSAGARLPICELLPVLKFARDHLPADRFGPVVEAAATDRVLDECVRVDDWETLIRFLIDGAARTKNLKHLRCAWRAWTRAFESLVLKQKMQDTRNAGELLHRTRIDIDRTLRPAGFDLSKEFLADSHLEPWWRNAPGLPDEALGFLMAEIRDVCRQIDGGPVADRLEVRNLVEAVLSGRVRRGQEADLSWALPAFAADDDRRKTHELIGLLSHAAEVLGNAAPDRDPSNPALRRNCRTVWKSVFECPGVDRFQVFAAMQKDGRFLDPTSARLLTETWFESLTEEEQVRQAGEWVASGRVASLSDDFACIVLQQASRAVTFVSEDHASDALAAQIAARNRAGVELPRLVLRQAVQDLHRDSGKVVPVRRHRVDERSYREFMNALRLHALLARPTTPLEYEETLRSIVHDAHVGAFMDVYLAHLRRPVRNRTDNRPLARFTTRLHRRRAGHDAVDDVALAFWLRSTPLDPIFKNWRRAALDTLADRIASVQGKRARRRVLSTLDGVLRREGLERSAVKYFRGRIAGSRNWLYRLLRRVFEGEVRG